MKQKHTHTDNRTATCPSCGEDFRLKKAPKRRQVVTCPHCHTALEVVGLDPIRLDWSYEVENEADI